MISTMPVQLEVVVWQDDAPFTPAPITTQFSVAPLKLPVVGGLLCGYVGIYGRCVGLLAVEYVLYT